MQDRNRTILGFLLEVRWAHFHHPCGSGKHRSGPLSRLADSERETTMPGISWNDSRKTCKNGSRFYRSFRSCVVLARCKQ